MFNTFTHHVHVDDSKLSQKTYNFDLAPGAYQDQYRMTNVHDIATSSLPRVPSGLSADIDFVSDRVVHMQLTWKPNRYSDEWLIQKFNEVWGCLWILFAVALILFSDAPLYGLVFPLVFGPIWFGQYYLVKKRATKRYAQHLAQAAYPGIIKLRQESVLAE